MRRRKNRSPILVEEFEIKEILPCFTTSGYIRFTAQADHESSEIIPVIFLKFPLGKTNYSAKGKFLTLRLFNRLITIFLSGKIGVTNTRDKKEAWEILEKIKGIINEAYADYSGMEKRIKRR